MHQTGIHTCPNCHNELQGENHFCPHCGQKQQENFVPSIKEFIAQSLDSIFNLDSKIFLTIRHLFIPAKLTTTYLQGERKKYYPPFPSREAIAAKDLDAYEQALQQTKSAFNALADSERASIEEWAANNLTQE